MSYPKEQQLEGMILALAALAAPIPSEPVKHRCASCNDVIPPMDTEIGACSHGLLCNLCRYDSQCLACKRERHTDMGVCDCPDCVSDALERAAVPALVGFASSISSNPYMAVIGNGLYCKTGRRK